MADQVSDLLVLDPQYQLGRPPGDGSASCMDNSIVEVIAHEQHRTPTPQQVRWASGHMNNATGLSPAEALGALAAFGIRSYRFKVRVSAEDVLRATDQGVVIVGVGYFGYPDTKEAQIGGKTDLAFTAAHAITCWGRRHGEPYGLRKGAWVCWCRDPDHSWAARDHLPRYDRFDTMYLVRAMAALITHSPWTVTFMLAKGD